MLSKIESHKPSIQNEKAGGKNKCDPAVLVQVKKLRKNAKHTVEQFRLSNGVTQEVSVENLQTGERDVALQLAQTLVKKAIREFEQGCSKSDMEDCLLVEESYHSICMRMQAIEYTQDDRTEFDKDFRKFEDAANSTMKSGDLGAYRGALDELAKFISSRINAAVVTPKSVTEKSGKPELTGEGKECSSVKDAPKRLADLKIAKSPKKITAGEKEENRSKKTSRKPLHGAQSSMVIQEKASVEKYELERSDLLVDIEEGCPAYPEEHRDLQAIARDVRQYSKFFRDEVARGTDCHTFVLWNLSFLFEKAYEALYGLSENEKYLTAQQTFKKLQVMFGVKHSEVAENGLNRLSTMFERHAQLIAEAADRSTKQENHDLTGQSDRAHGRNREKLQKIAGHENNLKIMAEEGAIEQRSKKARQQHLKARDSKGPALENVIVPNSTEAKGHTSELLESLSKRLLDDNDSFFKAKDHEAILRMTETCKDLLVMMAKSTNVSETLLANLKMLVFYSYRNLSRCAKGEIVYTYVAGRIAFDKKANQLIESSLPAKNSKVADASLLEFSKLCRNHARYIADEAAEAIALKKH